MRRGLLRQAYWQAVGTSSRGERRSLRGGRANSVHQGLHVRRRGTKFVWARSAPTLPFHGARASIKRAAASPSSSSAKITGRALSSSYSRLSRIFCFWISEFLFVSHSAPRSVYPWLKILLFSLDLIYDWIQNWNREFETINKFCKIIRWRNIFIQRERLVIGDNWSWLEIRGKGAHQRCGTR